MIDINYQNPILFFHKDENCVFLWKLLLIQIVIVLFAILYSGILSYPYYYKCRRFSKEYNSHIATRLNSYDDEGENEKDELFEMSRMHFSDDMLLERKKEIQKQRNELKKVPLL